MALKSFITENPQKQAFIAERLKEALACHEDPVEAIQAYDTPKLWIYFTSIGGVKPSSYLNPYEGYRLAAGLDMIFAPMPSRVWIRPQIVIDVSVMGRGNPERGPMRPTAVVSAGLTWMSEPVGDHDDTDSSYYITGIYAKMVSRLFSEELAARQNHIRLAVNVHNRELSDDPMFKQGEPEL